MAATRACIWPSGAIMMPSEAERRGGESSRPSQSVSDPLVVTPIRLPLRSATLLIGDFADTSSARFRGAPYMAATPIIGAPLTRKPSPGPDPRPTSRLPAASACCSCASPRKLDTARSSPSRSNIFASIPTSAAPKANELGTALPRRMVSRARDGQLNGTRNPRTIAKSDSLGHMQINANLRCGGAAHSSPPPCGEGKGGPSWVGVERGGTASPQPPDPLPQPSPTRGEGVAAALFIAITLFRHQEPAGGPRRNSRLPSQVFRLARADSA